MERSVVVGGALVAFSLMLAVALNGYAVRQAAPMTQSQAEPPPAELIDDQLPSAAPMRAISRVEGEQADLEGSVNAERELR
jgi:hypothetical protein